MDNEQKDNEQKNNGYQSFNEDLIMLDGIFFLTIVAIKANHVIVKRTFKDLYQHITNN